MRLASPPLRLAELDRIARQVSALPASVARTRWLINLGEQYGDAGEAGVPRAYQALDEARRSAAAATEPALQAQALDMLAQLYEDQQRDAEAIQLTRRPRGLAAALPAGAIGDREVRLEWRLARLDGKLGRPDAALAAWQRAVRKAEALRQDLPIEDERGRSTYRTVLQPVYLGLVEGLLASADRAPDAQGSRAVLRQVVDTIELLRQSELQDYLGDRCEVDAVKGGTATVIPPDVGVLYPIVFADRLELLLETSDGITRRRSAASAQQVRTMTSGFARNLRGGGEDFLSQARQLYDWVHAASRSAALRNALSLPGVGKEAKEIGKVAGDTRLLDQEFTIDNFRREAESGRYSVIHLASHGAGFIFSSAWSRHERGCRGALTAPAMRFRDCATPP